MRRPRLHEVQSCETLCLPRRREARLQKTEIVEIIDLIQPLDIDVLLHWITTKRHCFLLFPDPLGPKTPHNLLFATNPEHGCKMKLDPFFACLGVATT